MIPSNYLSIAHDNMDKLNTSIPRLGKKDKAISNFMDLPIFLTSILRHGHNIEGFRDFSISFWEMGSNFNITSLCKCIRDLEEPIVDLYGVLIYNSGCLKHPLHELLLQC